MFGVSVGLASMLHELIEAGMRLSCQFIANVDHLINYVNVGVIDY